MIHFWLLLCGLEQDPLYRIFSANSLSPVPGQQTDWEQVSSKRVKAGTWAQVMGHGEPWQD